LLINLLFKAFYHCKTFIQYRLRAKCVMSPSDAVDLESPRLTWYRPGRKSTLPKS